MNCTIEGCDKPIRCKALCSVHYRKQWVRQKEVLPCSVEGCDSLIRSIGLCLKHYQRQYQSGKPPAPDCSIAGCGKPQKAKTYCDMHYRRWKNHGNTEKMDITKNLELAIHQPEYRSWLNMKSRCYNPNDKRYYRYGGRGITICQQWLDSFWNYLEDVGRKPTPKHTIDRINNDGNYEPGNVRWATTREQNKNRSNSRPIPGVWSRTYKDGTVKWFVTLKVGKTWVYRQSFYDKEEAIKARKDAETRFLTGHSA